MARAAASLIKIKQPLLRHRHSITGDRLILCPAATGGRLLHAEGSTPVHGTAVNHAIDVIDRTKHALGTSFALSNMERKHAAAINDAQHSIHR